MIDEATLLLSMAAIIRRRGRKVALLLPLVTFALRSPAAAQTLNIPAELPAIPPDEKDFEGLTSLSLGSGARAFGMGGAFLARADDGTAASWNPAGLSYLRRPEISVAGARNSFFREGHLALFGDADPEITNRDQLKGNAPDFGAVAYPFDIRGSAGAVQVSFQRIFSFSGDRTISRPNARGNQATFTSTGSGGFDILAVGFGLKVTRNVRIGATLNRWFHGYHQAKQRVVRDPNLSLPPDVTDQTVDTRISGWNTNLGLIWSPLESLNLGVAGKTRLTTDLTLTRQRDDILHHPTRTETLHTGPFTREGGLTIPGAIGVGASWRPSSPLTISADYTLTLWSGGHIQNFFLLSSTPGERPTYHTLPYPTLDDEVQFNTGQIRIGAEYVLVGDRIKVPLRAGMFTDRQYFESGQGRRPAVENPDAGAVVSFSQPGRPPQFYGFTLGTGLLVGPILLDVAYVSERGRYVDTEPSPQQSRVTTRFRRVFVSMIYRFGSSR